MTRLPYKVTGVALVLMGALASAAAAQSPTPPPTPATGTQPASTGPWIVIGAGANALQGSCQFCEVESPPAKHTWTLFTDLGVRINEKMSAGAEISWVPAEASDGTPIRTTFLVGVAQFHPWKSSGFFVKGGAGVALIRNWVLEFDAPTLQKALAVHIGAGWIFQVTKRLKVELYGAQHAAALGDFETPQGTATNVMGNYWSAGAAVVIK